MMRIRWLLLVDTDRRSYWRRGLVLPKPFRPGVGLLRDERHLHTNRAGTERLVELHRQCRG